MIYDQNVLCFDEFRVNLARELLVAADGQPLALRPKTFAALVFLLQHPGRLISRTELIEKLWPGIAVTDDSLTQCISELRRAFGDRAAYVLQTLPRRGYTLIAEVHSDQDTARPARETTPSSNFEFLVVHPFTHLDSGTDAHSAAHHLANDLLVELAMMEGLHVAAPPVQLPAGSFNIRGDVSLIGSTVCASVKLEDEHGTTLWATRIEAGGPRFGISEIKPLAIRLSREVDRECLRRARLKSQSDLRAREAYLIGWDFYNRCTEADTSSAKAFFETAVSIDPNYGLPQAGLAFTAQRGFTNGWGTIPGALARANALSFAQRAVQLEPNSPVCLARLAFSLVLHQRWDEAVSTARAALQTGHHTSYEAQASCGEVLTASGHSHEGAEIIRQVLTYDPFCPPAIRAILGRALLLSGDPEAALSELYWCAARMPDHTPCFHSLVVAAFETGRMSEACSAFQAVTRLQPNWTPATTPVIGFSDGRRTFRDSLRRSTLFVSRPKVRICGPRRPGRRPERSREATVSHAPLCITGAATRTMSSVLR